LLGLIQREKVTFSHCVPTLLHMLLNSPANQNVDLQGRKNDHRRLGPPKGALSSLPGAGCSDHEHAHSGEDTSGWH
jgi:hypothetical protein